MTITAPGVYDLPLADYVADPCADPSLSPSIARLLVDKTPAHAKLKHPRLTLLQDEEWDSVANFGTAVHSMAFGGAEIVELDYDSWRTKEARRDRDAALAANKVPLLDVDVERARDCAAVVHDAIAELLGPGVARYESTLVWKDHGVTMRCRPDVDVDMRTIVDLKVTQTDPRDANRHFFNQGHDMQAAFFERGANALDPKGRGRRRIVYLYVEDKPPFMARALPVSEATLTIARKRLIAARNIWRSCRATNEWPKGPLLLPSSDMPGFRETAWLARELNEPQLIEEDAAA